MRRRDCQGATLILLVLMMLTIIALAALVIDVNSAQRSQKRLQSIADMTSVSAGVMLPDQTDASQTASSIATANGATSVSVTYPNPGEVRVALQQANRYFFAPFLGVNNKVVAAAATAASRGGHFIPLAIQDQSLTPGTEYTFTLVRLTGQTLGGNDLVALSVGGTGELNFITRLEDGYTGDYPKGSGKLTEEGATLEDSAMTGLVSDASTGNAVFEQAAQSPWLDDGTNYSYPNYPEGDPRIAVIARVVQPVAGDPAVTVNRFGAAYLRDYTVSGGAGKGKGKGKGKGGGGSTSTGVLTLVWLGDFTAVAGNPNRGWFQSKGLTRLSQ